MSIDDIFWYVVLFLLFFGESIRDFFLSIVSAVTNRRYLTRKDAKRLAKENQRLTNKVDRLETRLRQADAALHEVHLSDKTYPQLPPGTSRRVDEYLERREIIPRAFTQGEIEPKSD